ncbi:MAG: DUF4097 family beta strand repeat-containing protein [Candidatus Thermoplasmatota archaeon]
MRSPLLALLLTAALLSGCLVEEADPATDAQGIDPAPSPAGTQPAQQSVDPAKPDEPTPAAPHGTPQRTDSAVTSGTDPQGVPAAWARQSITITNGFGAATLGDLAASISAGSITVRAADRADYLVEATLEARAGTEADARAVLERTHLDHSDTLDGSTLFLEDKVRIDPPASPSPLPLPPGVLDLNVQEATVRVDLVITVPLAPAIDLAAGASSGDIAASDLHGPRLDLSTSSGAITVNVAAMDDVSASASSGDVRLDTLTTPNLRVSTSSGDVAGSDLTVGSASVSTSSGDAVLKGTIDSIDADSSSGDLSFEVAAAASGKYAFDSSSGEVVLKVPADGAYAVEAGTSSGDITVDVPDAEVIEDEEDHVEVATEGYDDADIQTAIDASTSSGDITVQAE